MNNNENNIVNSGELEKFVLSKKGNWNHEDWLIFVSLLESKYGIFDKNIISNFLEKEKQIYYLKIANGQIENKLILAPAKQNGKWGFIDQNGNWVIENKYENVVSFSEGIAGVSNNNGFGYIDKDENIIINFSKNYFGQPFHEDFSIIQHNNKHGYINKLGQVIVPTYLDEAFNFSGGIAKIREIGSHKYKFINTKGNEIFNSKEVIDIYSFSDEGLALICKYTQKILGNYYNAQYGFINKDFEEVIPAKYTNAYSFHEGFASVQKVKDGKYGVIDKNGKLVIDFKYKYINYFSDGLALCEKGILKELCFININGEIVIKNLGYEVNLFNENEIDYFHDGMAKISMKEKYGFINRTGNLIVQCKYSEAHNFNDGLALVSIGRYDDYTFIDKKGNEITNKYYQYAQDFSEGLAVIRLKGYYGFINKNGDEVIPPKFEEVRGFKNIDSTNN